MPKNRKSAWHILLYNVSELIVICPVVEILSAKTFIGACLSRGITGVTAWTGPICIPMNVDAYGPGGKRLLASSTGSTKKSKIKSSEVDGAARNPSPSATKFLSNMPFKTAATPEMAAGQILRASTHHRTVTAATNPHKSLIPPREQEYRPIDAPETPLHHTPLDGPLLLVQSQSDVASARSHLVAALDNPAVDHPTQASLRHTSALRVDAHQAELDSLGHDAQRSNVTLSRLGASALASVPADFLLGVPPVQSTPSGASRLLQASDSSRFGMGFHSHLAVNGVEVDRGRTSPTSAGLQESNMAGLQVQRQQ